MQAVSSRHQSGETPSHRTPRKSSSFLSLRREKDKSSSLALDSNTSTSSGPLHTKPFSYFDAYPRTKSSPTSRSHKSRTRRSSPSSVGTCAESSASIHLQERSKGPKEATYAFPSFDSTEDLSTPTPLNTTPYFRTRSRTGPSSKSKWDPMSAVPQLRFSGSSSTQHTETPPRTPDDYLSSRESFDHFPVFVSAPVSGVEMMDALVDGMNGGSILGETPSTSNRARFGIPGHHPLYQPPLPTPPPGVVLGGGKVRRPKVARRESPSSDSGDDENDSPNLAAFNARSRRRRARPSSSRTASNSTITPIRSYTSADENILSSSSVRNTPAREPSRPGSAHPQLENRKSVVPSISEIIRAHAPPEGQTRSRPSTIRSSSLYTPSHGHGTVHEEVESEPEPLTVEEETELLSRSSIDSVADEVQRTLRHQHTIKPPPSAPPSAFLNRHSVISDNASLYSPRSDPGAAPSIYSSSAASIYQQPGSPLDATFLSLLKPSPSQAVAQYLRSARLTTLLHLTRSPHASRDNPLTISLSDLGNPTGFPVVVFLGLGCVRHIMGLYDEMAECLGLRLITIDRWGLGRTEPRSKSAKGIMQWASVVEEVLDLLHIKQCSVMAHSAGAPYALSFANKLPSRIRGDVCLLAPWVGGSESSGYKWLKYIPNGILKTAQAAEWKLQAWMIGKPPTIAYEGIGYNAPRPQEPKRAASHSNGNLNVVYPSNGEGRPRPSIGSGTFSEYDDLGDFEGRFESRSTLGAGQGNGTENVIFVNKRKTSKGFLERLKGSPTLPPSHPEEKQSSRKKLKGLRSMGSLKGKTHVPLRKSESSSPQLPPPLTIEVGLGLEELNWTNSFAAHAKENMRQGPSTTRSVSSHEPTIRSVGQRSISFTSGKPLVSMPGSPSPSTVTTTFTPSNGPNNYQAALGNALLAASHAESAKGTHDDLLQILNHENHSWGFSYASYPHKVRVWYGDKDEKIAENAVRWMERTMGANRCSVKVVKGADHGLMYRSSVVVDVLEWVLAAWRTGEQSQPFSDLR